MNLYLEIVLLTGSIGLAASPATHSAANEYLLAMAEGQ